MATTAGVLSLTSIAQTSAVVTSAVATGGTGPYTYQLYVSTTSGFSPGGGTLIAGATNLVNTVTGLIPGTQYYFKMVATDSGAVSGTSSQLAGSTTNPVPNQNQFNLTSQLGTVDMAYNFNTHPVQIDVSQVGTLYAGAAVKLVAGSGGQVPKVVGCSASSDAVLGFLNYNVKNIGFVAGQAAEISLKGNIMYLYATGAIVQGAQVQLDITTNGGVATSVGSSGAEYVGWAYDGAAAAGALIRVYIETPSYKVF